MAGTGELSLSYCIHNQEADHKQEVGLGYKTLRSVPSNPFLPVRLLRMKIPQPFQIASPFGDQMFKQVSLWGTFHFLTTFIF